MTAGGNVEIWGYTLTTEGVGGSWLAYHRMPAVVSLEEKKNETIIERVTFDITSLT
jgi:hypothetical protein